MSNPCEIVTMYEIKKEPIYPSIIDNDKSFFYGPCCCCMELVCRKSIWSQYQWMGCAEVYGDMIQECFGLTIPQDQNAYNQICEVCVTRLRNALCFRRQVLDCQAKLISKITAQKGITALLPDVNDSGNDDEEDLRTLPVDPKGTTDITEDEVGVFKPQRPVVRGLKISNGKETKQKRDGRQTNYIKTRQNICLILEHSTLVPFKSSNGYFNCFFCSKQYVVFEKLRNHVSDKHGDVKSKGIRKCILRPNVIKADISDASCKLCPTKVDSVRDLVHHLEQTHSVAFELEGRCKPEDCIVPYNLSEGRYRCCVCGEEFLFFKTLSRHMNEHSANYVCDVCGKCFLLPERLRAHRRMHKNNSSAKCEVCGKVYSSIMHLRSHIRYSHKKVPYACSICNESFPTFKERLKHMESVHGRRTRLDCGSCMKSFKSLGSLNAHMRTDHLRITREAKFPCPDCSMMFKFRSALKCHQVVHSGERNFECEVCHKRYGRAKTLVEHLKIHSNDRRWSCGDCGQAFVQKCSLRNHIRVHHGGRDLAKLILYKKPDK